MASRALPRILFVAHNAGGGAGAAAYRLFQALRSAGAEVRFLVYEDAKPGVQLWYGPVAQHPLKSPWRKFSKLASRRRSSFRSVVRWGGVLWEDRQWQDRSGAFEIVSLRLGWAELSRHPWFSWAEVVHLHWTAGFLAPRQDFGSKHWVISLHDCYPFTAVCHFSNGCRGFETGCRSCPQLSGIRTPSLSAVRFHQKLAGYRPLRHGTVHAPSRWMAGLCSRSALLGHLDIQVLPNLFPTTVFRPQDQEASRRLLGLRPEGPLALFVSGHLANQRKGTPLFLELTKRPELAGWTFVVVGAGHLELQEKNTVLLGSVSDLRLMAAVYSAADVFVTASLEDNYPSTVAESQLCGTPVVGFAVGGQPEMVEQGTTGWLSRQVSTEGLVEGFRWYADQKPDRQVIARGAFSRWSEDKVTAQWHDFYRKLV